VQQNTEGMVASIIRVLLEIYSLSSSERIFKLMAITLPILNGFSCTTFWDTV